MKQDGWVNFLVGTLVGGFSFFIIYLVISKYAIDTAAEIVITAAIFVVVALAIFSAIFIGRNRITRWIFGRTKSSFQGIALYGFRAFSNMRRGKPVSAYRNAKRGLMSAIATYSWWAFRMWVVRVVMTFVAIFAGGVGTFLLIEQNQKLQAHSELLTEQNKLLGRQSLLQDAQSRTALLPVLSDVIGEIFKVAGRNFNPAKNEKISLDPILMGRIVSLAASLRPYWHYDYIALGEVGPDSVAAYTSESNKDENLSQPLIFLSPERGLLLRSMIAANVDMSAKILENADFSYSDLRNLNISSEFYEKNRSLLPNYCINFFRLSLFLDGNKSIFDDKLEKSNRYINDSIIYIDLSRINLNKSNFSRSNFRRTLIKIWPIR